jgi:hypothetical protein
MDAVSFDDQPVGFPQVRFPVTLRLPRDAGWRHAARLRCMEESDDGNDAGGKRD